jgi:hypothetical protein
VVAGQSVEVLQLVLLTLLQHNDPATIEFDKKQRHNVVKASFVVEVLISKRKRLHRVLVLIVVQAIGL